MNKLPDFNKQFEYENNFYLSCHVSRIGKLIMQYELYKMSRKIPGEIVECGVFKGASLIRFAMFQKLFGAQPKKVIGFDVFDKFPEAQFSEDKIWRERIIQEIGEYSIPKDRLMKVLKHKDINFVELVKGDIVKTVPAYLNSHPELKISLLNLDADFYEPSVIILDHFYPRLAKGGVLIVDDYKRIPGETKAVDDYFKDQNIEIKEFSYEPRYRKYFKAAPYYIIKK